MISNTHCCYTPARTLTPAFWPNCQNFPTRLLCKRVGEHKSALSTCRKSAVADHTNTTGHTIDFDGASIICQVRSYHLRILTEAMAIKLLELNLNGQNEFNLHTF
ncbi:hypothetical protein GJ496_009180 [Pomphorhynchus laevis]|nr:hypothetical protein GJ496_009180 [Pomphorhynchus laevis]